MIALVFASRQHDPGLMQKDYYALDLNYQDRLDRKQNAAKLSRPPQVQVAAAEQSLTIQFPDSMNNVLDSAKFYRSSTVKDDFLIKIEKPNPGAELFKTWKKP